MSVPKRWAIPDDWDEQQDGYISVLFCIPNSRQWRGLIVGMIEGLAYGRNWDEQTGIVIDVQQVGRDIFESMMMGCIEELNTNMDRIATALESINAKTEALIDWDEFLEDVENTFGITNAAYLMFKFISDHFPSLKVKVNKTEILRMAWEYWGWRIPILAELTAMNGSLAIMAAAQAGEKVMNLFNTLMNGLDFVQRHYDTTFGALQGTFWGVYGTITDWFRSDSEGGTGGEDPDSDGDLRVTQRLMVQQIAATTVGLNAIQSRLADLNTTMGDCAKCGGVGCSNCREGGLVEHPSGIDLAGYFPADFVDCTEYTAYKCKAANMVIDHLVFVLDELSQYYSWFRSNHGAGGVQPYLSPIETYNRIGNFLPELLPNSIEYNLTPSQMAAIKQEMNDRYTNFHRQNVGEDWANFGQNVTEFFTNVFGTVRDRWQTDIDTLKQAIFDAQSASEVKTYLSNRFGTDFQYVRDTYPFSAHWVDEAEQTMNNMMVNGFLNIPFFQSSFALAHTGTYQCTGDGGCSDQPPGEGTCYTVDFGTYLGSNEWQGEFISDRYSVSINAISGKKLSSISYISGGPTEPPPSGNSYVITNLDLTDYYNANTPFGAETGNFKGFTIRGTNPFSVTVTFVCEAQ